MGHSFKYLGEFVISFSLSGLQAGDFLFQGGHMVGLHDRQV